MLRMLLYKMLLPSPSSFSHHSYYVIDLQLKAVSDGLKATIEVLR